MNRPTIFAMIAAVAAIVAVPALVTPAQAQLEVHIGTPQPNGGAWGDRDRDGVPNAYDQRNNNYRQQAWGDRDRDGVPNAVDPNNNTRRRSDADRDGVANRYDTDKDGDGVPNSWDRNAGNPYRR